MPGGQGGLQLVPRHLERCHGPYRTPVSCRSACRIEIPRDSPEAKFQECCWRCSGCKVRDVVAGRALLASPEA